MSLITRVGCDRRGRVAVEELRRRGVLVEQVQEDPRHETGWARVALNERGEPRYRFAARPVTPTSRHSTGILPMRWCSERWPSVAAQPGVRWLDGWA